jgi:hypothetical protein
MSVAQQAIPIEGLVKDSRAALHNGLIFRRFASVSGRVERFTALLPLFVPPEGNKG